MLIIRCHLTEQSIRNIYEVAAEESQLCDRRGNSVNGFIVWPAESWIVRSIYLCQLGPVCPRRKTRTVKQASYLGGFYLTSPPLCIRSGEPRRRRRGLRTCCFVQRDTEMALKKLEYQSCTEHLQNISVLFVSYLHAAHPRTAAHVESEVERATTTQPHTLISDITHDGENTV